MGILKDKVRKAFIELKKNNIRAFAEKISDVSDVRYAHHKAIVDTEIEQQLRAFFNGYKIDIKKVI